MTEKPPTLYKAVTLHLLECSRHLSDQPEWLAKSLDDLGAAYNAYGASQSANVDRDAVGRKQSGKRPEVKRRLLAGESIYRIRKDLGVGASMVERVAEEIAAEKKATVTRTKKQKKRGK